MLILQYPTKGELRRARGQPLQYVETSKYPEFRPNGIVYGSNRPRDPRGKGRKEWFAKVGLLGGRIDWVE